MKKKLIKGLHIDSETQSIGYVEVEQDNISHIHKHLKCNIFTCIGMPNREAMYVDDESLLFPEAMFGGFVIPPLQIVVVGNALILGTGRSGSSIDTEMSLMLLNHIQWLTPEQCRIYANMVFAKGPQILPMD
jgi:hypothetical protein